MSVPPPHDSNEPRIVTLRDVYVEVQALKSTVNKIVGGLALLTVLVGLASFKIYVAQPAPQTTTPHVSAAQPDTTR